jgi:membrane-bound ClpP family serine protease
MVIYLLLVIGLTLLFIEFFLPGGILGVIGGLLILSSIIMFASQSTSLWAVSLFTIGTLAAVGLVMAFALWRIKQSKSKSSFYSDQSQEGFQASVFDQTTIGKTGVVISDLKPGGYISIEGKQHQAISISGYIPKGEKVEVLSGQEESLIVKLKG